MISQRFDALQSRLSGRMGYYPEWIATDTHGNNKQKTSAIKGNDQILYGITVPKRTPYPP
jgi:hypothetical protein